MRSEEGEMAKRRRTRRTRRGDSRGDQERLSVVDTLLHLQASDERPWKFLLPEC